MSKSVYITREIPSEGTDLLKKSGFQVKVNPHDRDLTPEELHQAIQSQDAVLCMLTDRIDRNLMKECPHIRIYANYAVGYNNLDLEAATQLGIALTNTPGVLTEATADLAWALLFSAARRIVEADRYVRKGDFQGWAPMLYLGADITGQTLGIVGPGRIGTAMALRSRGFGMKVLYTGNRNNPILNREIKAQQVDLKTLLERSDYVSLHVPYNVSTKHLIGEKELKRMKSSALLINTARGAVIDEKALIHALKAGEIAGAGLDVYEEEPLLQPGLAELPHVVLLPHIGSATFETRRRMALMAAKNIIACFEGQCPPNLLNPEIWGTAMDNG